MCLAVRCSWRAPRQPSSPWASCCSWAAALRRLRGWWGQRCFLATTGVLLRGVPPAWTPHLQPPSHGMHTSSCDYMPTLSCHMSAWPVYAGACRFNPVETLVYVGVPTAAVLLFLSLVFEGGSILGGAAGALLLQHPAPFLYAFALSFMVGVASCSTLI